MRRRPDIVTLCGNRPDSSLCCSARRPLRQPKRRRHRISGCSMSIPTPSARIRWFHRATTCFRFRDITSGQPAEVIVVPSSGTSKYCKRNSRQRIRSSILKSSESIDSTKARTIIWPQHCASCPGFRTRRRRQFGPTGRSSIATCGFWMRRTVFGAFSISRHTTCLCPRTMPR